MADAVLTPLAVCWVSTVSQAKPARAMNRAAVTLPSDSQVPTAGLPARSSCLTALGRIASPRGGAVLYTPCRRRRASPVPFVGRLEPLLHLGVDVLHVRNRNAVRDACLLGEAAGVDQPAGRLGVAQRE